MTNSKHYAWWVVAMLWFVCLFNYADRQAVYSVFEPLKEEMQLTDVQLGIVGGSFMWCYAAVLPLAGIVGDRFSRKWLILGGLTFWSFITVATAWSTEYWHLVLFRALEGVGEAFYFPASMSLISDYHGPATRSRAMALHQSSVYVGTILGGTAAGFLAEAYGWRSGFYVFGIVGIVLAMVLLALLKEPPRGVEAHSTDLPPAKDGKDSVLAAVGQLLSTPMVLVLIAAFIGANFVAVIFLTWMPSYLSREFGMSLGMAGLKATVWLQIASVVGVVAGGMMADREASHWRGGRMLIQSLGLLAGAPFIFLTGWTMSVTVLTLAMIGFGFFKGWYDANIWASLYDVVPAQRRATAQGLMNSIGWTGAGVAPVVIAIASQKYGMGACLAATSVIYLVVGGGLLLAAILWGRGQKMPLGGDGSLAKRC